MTHIHLLESRHQHMIRRQFFNQLWVQKISLHGEMLMFTLGEETWLNINRGPAAQCASGCHGGLKFLSAACQSWSSGLSTHNVLCFPNSARMGEAHRHSWGTWPISPAETGRSFQRRWVLERMEEGLQEAGESATEQRHLRKSSLHFLSLVIPQNFVGWIGFIPLFLWRKWRCRETKHLTSSHWAW